MTPTTLDEGLLDFIVDQTLSEWRICAETSVGFDSKLVGSVLVPNLNKTVPDFRMLVSARNVRG
jgi:hypothetical protein